MTFFEFADRAVAILAFVLAVGLITGYVRLAGNVAPLVRHFAMSQVLIAGSYACRTIYWDLILPISAGEIATFEINSNGGSVVNIAFNVALLAGAHHGLRALHLMIPEQDRPKWSWITAPLYPPWRLTLGLMLVFRAVRRIVRGR